MPVKALLTGYCKPERLPNLLYLVSAVLLFSLLLSASAFTQPPATGPLVSEQEFFSMLDYSLPYLSKVQTAVNSGDYATAKVELLSAMRSRRKPVSHINWWQRPAKLDPKYDRTIADEFLHHIFAKDAFKVYPRYEMGEKMIWDANPCHDREWTWALNRHFNWLIMAQAYWATGDEAYAKEVNSELIDWVTNCPVVTNGRHNSSPSWRTIECGIRMFSIWPAVYQHFLGSPNFTPEANELFLRSIVDHARHLVKNSGGGNWLVMESNGLVHMGTLYPELKDAPEWRRIGFERLNAELKNQVYPDGF